MNDTISRRRAGGCRAAVRCKGHRPRGWGWGQRQVYHLIDVAGLPSFKLGQIVCARVDDLQRWVAERAAAGREAR